MVFRIYGIEAGWFEVILDEACILTNSNYAHNDAPRRLLENVAHMFTMTSGIIRLCWQNEPGALIWRFDLVQGQVHTHIIDCETQASYKLSYEGESLSLFDQHKCVFEAQDTLCHLASSIYQAFKKYSKGDLRQLYEKEWMPFPDEAFEKLGSYLGSEMKKQK